LIPLEGNTDGAGIDKVAHKAQGDRNIHGVISRRILNPVEHIPPITTRGSYVVLHPAGVVIVQQAAAIIHQGLYQFSHSGGDRVPGVISDFSHHAN
jgi:hypothetical protein